MTIKINKNLVKNAYFNPTEETVSKTISQICAEVSKGEIIMPIFQRDLGWTTQKKVELFNFQLNGYAPIAPISMNKIANNSLDMPHVVLITREELDSASIIGFQSVIDGQQRISANFQAYINHESIRSVVLDLTRGIFLDIGDKDIKKNQIPVGILYNHDPQVYISYIKLNPLLAEFDVSSLLGQIRTKHFNYFYTVNFARDLSGFKQISWFDVLNLAGSRVPDKQMKLTRLQVRGVDFYKEYSDKFQEKLEIYGLENLFVKKETQVSIPLAALNPSFEVVLNKPHTANASPIPSDGNTSLIVELEADSLRKCFDLTLSALDQSLDFIASNYLEQPSKIDYISYLTGFFVFKDGQPLTKMTKQNLVEWYQNVNFTNKSNTERREIFTNLLKI